MKETDFYVSPFRLLSPRLDLEASRLKELLESPPLDITALEEGLLVMCSKLIEFSDTLYKTFLIADETDFRRCQVLAEEVHKEEKVLTDQLVRSPSAPPAVLKALILFPGRLERVGDLLESVLNVSMTKARDGIPFSDKAMSELKQLFDLFTKILSDFRDVLATCNKTLLNGLGPEHSRLAQMTIDFAMAHEDRLIEKACVPIASSLYTDILDSMRDANRQICSMTERLIQVAVCE